MQRLGFNLQTSVPVFDLLKEPKTLPVSNKRKNRIRTSLSNVAKSAHRLSDRFIAGPFRFKVISQGGRVAPANALAAEFVLVPVLEGATEHWSDGYALKDRISERMESGEGEGIVTMLPGSVEPRATIR